MHPDLSLSRRPGGSEARDAKRWVTQRHQVVGNDQAPYRINANDDDTAFGHSSHPRGQASGHRGRGYGDNALVNRWFMDSGALDALPGPPGKGAKGIAVAGGVAGGGPDEGGPGAGDWNLARGLGPQGVRTLPTPPTTEDNQVHAVNKLFTRRPTDSVPSPASKDETPATLSAFDRGFRRDGRDWGHAGTERCSPRRGSW